LKLLRSVGNFCCSELVMCAETRVTVSERAWHKIPPFLSATYTLPLICRFHLSPIPQLLYHPILHMRVPYQVCPRNFVHRRQAAVIARLRQQAADQQDVIRQLTAARTACSERSDGLERMVSDLREEVRTLRLVSSPLQFRAFMDLLVGRI
jgi:hypothetical protein